MPFHISQALRETQVFSRLLPHRFINYVLLACIFLNPHSVLAITCQKNEKDKSITIDNHRLIIPPGFVDANLSGPDMLTIRALLPSMESKDLGNESEFNKTHWDNVALITISGWDPSLKTGDKLFSVLETGDQNTLSRQNLESMKSIPNGRIGLFKEAVINWDLLAGRFGEHTLVATCNPSNSVPYPSCTAQEHIGAFLVRYTFSRKFLIQDNNFLMKIYKNVSGLIDYFLSADALLQTNIANSVNIILV